MFSENNPEISLAKIVADNRLVTGDEKILVLGAKGQVAQFLVPELKKYYPNNLILADREADPDNKIVGIDVTRKDELEKRIYPGSDVKVVINLAALLSGESEKNLERAKKVNVEAPQTVLDLAKQSGVRKVFIPSSIAVLGKEARQKDDEQRAVINRRAKNSSDGKFNIGEGGFGAPLDSKVWSANASFGEYGKAKSVIESASEAINKQYIKRGDLLAMCLRYGGVLTCQPDPSDGTTEAGFDKIIALAAEYKATNDSTKQVHHAAIPAESTFPMLDGRTVATETMRFLHADPENINFRKNAHHYGLAEYSASVGDVVGILKKLSPDFAVKFAEPGHPYDDKKLAFVNSWPRHLDVSDSVKDWGFQQHYNLEESVRHHFNGLVQHFKWKGIRDELGIKPGGADKALR